MTSKFDRAKSSKTFCVLPWIHQYVGPAGDVKPCCMYQMDMSIGNFKTNSLKEIWNNNDTKQLRLDMLNGKKIDGCKKCNIRDNLSWTPRDTFNKIFINDEVKEIINSTEDDGTISDHRLHYIDARFNNLCNLKCRTCGPDYSTSWGEDHDRLTLENYGVEIIEKNHYRFSGSNEKSLLEEILPHLSNVKSIYFAGGEPLMQQDHYEILKTLIDINHPGLLDENKLTINYNTNFTNLKLGKYYAPELWKNFKNITLNASLDGSYERAEYWRKGTKWDKIVENRKVLQNICPNVKFKINYTVSWPNIFNLFDFHKEWVELGFIKIDDLTINLLDTPSYYSLKSLPNWKKIQIAKYCGEYQSWLSNNYCNKRIVEQVNDLIKFMYTESHGSNFPFVEDFQRACLTLDKIRNENFWDIFIEHRDLKRYFE